ncbi:MAG: hypothetical protein RJQ14_06005, partial [Marinoscillum sp.]
MKTIKLGLLSFFMIALMGLSCTNTKKSEENADETSGTMELKANITLTKAPPSPEFPAANLIKRGDAAITP